VKLNSESLTLAQCEFNYLVLLLSHINPISTCDLHGADSCRHLEWPPLFIFRGKTRIAEAQGYTHALQISRKPHPHLTRLSSTAALTYLSRGTFVFFTHVHSHSRLRHSRRATFTAHRIQKSHSHNQLHSRLMYSKRVTIAAYTRTAHGLQQSHADTSRTGRVTLTPVIS
jgi:hypothetical protein